MGDGGHGADFGVMWSPRRISRRIFCQGISSAKFCFTFLRASSRNAAVALGVSAEGCAPCVTAALSSSSSQSTGMSMGQPVVPHI